MKSAKSLGFRKFVLAGLAALAASLPLQLRGYSPGTMQDRSTHPLLSDASIRLFLERSGNQMDADKGEAIVSGSIQEDSPHASYIRSYNHFTDWSSHQGLWGFLSSKLWSQSPEAQQGNVPLDNFRNTRLGALKTYYESVLEEYEGKYPEGNRTWQRALEGDWQSVGHLLHLVQDATVPAHVRNDPHAGLISAIANAMGADFSDQWLRFISKTDFHDDSYEIWAKDHPAVFQEPPLQSLESLEVRSYASVDHLFEETITFTGSNFFSDNSIGKYDLPAVGSLAKVKEDCTPTPFGPRGCVTYYYGTVKETDESVLDAHVPLARKGFLTPYVLDSKVLETQWKFLSVKAIENGASLISLYFENIGEERPDGGASCTPNPRTYCEENDVYFNDGCGNRELIETCSSGQHCSNGGCIDDVVNGDDEPAECNPAAGCGDANCVFYDDFNGSTLDQCRWVYTDITISNGEAVLEPGQNLLNKRMDNPPIERSYGSYNCQNFSLEFRGRSNQPARFSVLGSDNSISDFMVMYTSRDQLELFCNTTRGVVAEGVDITQDNTIMVQKSGDNLDFYVNGSQRATLPCSTAGFGQILVMNNTNGSTLRLNHIKAICDD